MNIREEKLEYDVVKHSSTYVEPEKIVVYPCPECCVPSEQPKKLSRIDILQSMTVDSLASFLSEITSCCMTVGYYSNPDIECCQQARCPFAEGLTDINECSAESIKRWLEEEFKEG